MDLDTNLDPYVNIYYVRLQFLYFCILDTVHPSFYVVHESILSDTESVSERTTNKKRVTITTFI